MCGIAGWYRRGNRPVSKKTIVRQCNALRHRGPDDSGYFIDADVGMGMRRLSIIDVEGGHQPMALHDGRYTIVFNGEIYNHRDYDPFSKPKVIALKPICLRTCTSARSLAIFPNSPARLGKLLYEITVFSCWWSQHRNDRISAPGAEHRHILPMSTATG